MKHTWINEFFRWDEFRCNDGTPVPARYLDNVQALADLLLVVRANWGRPITILSGYRTPVYNKKIGGAPKSQHLRGKAADIVVAGISPREVQSTLVNWSGGLGSYKTFTHIDIGPKRRWNG